MHAAITVGGEGVRLRPYTTAPPKPPVPTGDRHAPLEIVLRRLSAAGFTSCTITIDHLGHLARLEDSPLGTMGPLLTTDRLPEHFLVMNGAVPTDLDYADVLRSHREARTPPRAYEFDGHRLGIGRPDDHDYDRADAEFTTHRPLLLKGA